MPKDIKSSKVSLTGKKASNKDTYHHGNLKETLIEASAHIIKIQGIEGLSLRKLADQVGVSRAAPYHHFKDKNALLASVAEAGFKELSALLNSVVNQDKTLPECLREAVKGYLAFANEHPTQYDLMFGQKLWKSDQFNDFQRHAKDCFRLYVQLFEQLKEQQQLKPEEDPLRLAQLLWAALHGLAKLTEEGLFSMANSTDEITDYALSRFENSLVDSKA
ncbi:MAG: AcrR family transcriptional regulator [Bermanella sp.]|jgi:AcrR family transcriptional regulator